MRDTTLSSVVAATKYTKDSILDAAALELASSGFETASVASIARSLGAPSGSIYHRFPSKKHLIGELWVRTATRYGDSLSTALTTTSTAELAVRIVDHTFGWIDTHPTEAALLMQFRTEDFTPGDWPDEVVVAIQEINGHLANSILTAAQQHGIDPVDMMLATIDIPAAAARRSLLLADPNITARLRDRTVWLVNSLVLTSRRGAALAEMHTIADETGMDL